MEEGPLRGDCYSRVGSEFMWTSQQGPRHRRRHRCRPPFPFHSVTTNRDALSLTITDKLLPTSLPSTAQRSRISTFASLCTCTHSNLGRRGPSRPGLSRPCCCAVSRDVGGLGWPSLRPCHVCNFPVATLLEHPDFPLLPTLV